MKSSRSFLADFGLGVSANTKTCCESSLIELKTSIRFRVCSLTRRESDHRRERAVMSKICGGRVWLTVTC